MEIRLQKAQNKLYLLSFEYKNMRNNAFIDKRKCSDMVKDQDNFLIKMEDLKPYIIKFKENYKEKSKVNS